MAASEDATQVIPYEASASPQTSSEGFFVVDSGREGFSGEQEWPEEEKEQACERDQFLDLEELQFFSTEGIDKQGRRILRVVGKFFPAALAVDKSRLRDYVVYKISREVSNEPFCVVYFHTRAKRNENCPGVFNLRWIYETLPQEFRVRLEAFYFVHPGLVSSTIMGTIGRLLSNGLYDKLNYASRLEFLWDHVRKGQLEVPDFIFEHDKVLEERPLMDYWLESDAFISYAISGSEHRQPLRWAP